MAEHHLPSDHPHPFWDRDLPPRLTVESGDVVVVDCPEPCGQVTPNWNDDDLAQRFDPALVHALIGPVQVKGHKAGQTLEVELLALEHHGWGWSGHTPGFGLLADEFDFAFIHHWTLGADCEFGRGIRVPLRPFCGCLGVAPARAGRLVTMPPRANGGNIDIPDLGVGATAWLPTFHDGGLFSCGDCHAAQGHGEVGGTGIEAPMRVTLRLTSRPDMHIDQLQYQTPAPPPPPSQPAGCHVTTAHGPDLMDNARHATRRMIAWLGDHHSLSPSEALILCSAAADLRISEIVDRPNWMVTMTMPLSVLGPAHRRG